MTKTGGGPELTHRSVCQSLASLPNADTTGLEEKKTGEKRGKMGWRGAPGPLGSWAGQNDRTVKALGSTSCFPILFPTFDQVPSGLQRQKLQEFKTGEGP